MTFLGEELSVWWFQRGWNVSLAHFSWSTTVCLCFLVFFLWAWSPPTLGKRENGILNTVWWLWQALREYQRSNSMERGGTPGSLNSPALPRARMPKLDPAISRTQKFSDRYDYNDNSKVMLQVPCYNFHYNWLFLDEDMDLHYKHHIVGLLHVAMLLHYL